MYAQEQTSQTTPTLCRQPLKPENMHHSSICHIITQFTRNTTLDNSRMCIVTPYKYICANDDFHQVNGAGYEFIQFDCRLKPLCTTLFTAPVLLVTSCWQCAKRESAAADKDRAVNVIDHAREAPLTDGGLDSGKDGLLAIEAVSVRESGRLKPGGKIMTVLSLSSNG